jgi:hypothetical protein
MFIRRIPFNSPYSRKNASMILIRRFREINNSAETSKEPSRIEFEYVLEVQTSIRCEIGKKYII